MTLASTLVSNLKTKRAASAASSEQIARYVGSLLDSGGPSSRDVSEESHDEHN